MKVTIDGELTTECVGLLPNRWNGWECPIFTEEQKQFVEAEIDRLGWHDTMTRVQRDSEWRDLGNGQWTTIGWIWQTA